jgi:hypothetical protein
MALLRAGGELDGVALVHVVPSQIQVSLFAQAKQPWTVPPKSTTVPFGPGAMAGKSRELGEFVGVS